MATKTPFRALDGINTTFINTTKGTDIASATTTDIGASTGEYVNVTGTATITGLGSSLPYAGAGRIVTFTGVLVITNNATSLILPTGANITTQAGDTAFFRYLGSGNWKCVGYLRADGTALAGSGGVTSASGATTDSQITVYNGTSGSSIKTLTSTGIPYLTSGVVSISKVTLTQPATGSTLTIADGKTLTANNSLTLAGTDGKTLTLSNTLTFTGTDSSSVAFGSGGTVLYSGGALGTPSSGTLTNATGLPISTGVSGLGTGIATWLATPSSANLYSALTDKTGSGGSAVFATSPTLVTPTLGVATATTINKVTITAPATGSTLTVADGKTLVVSNTLTFTGTDSSSVAFGAGGTVLYSGGNINIGAGSATSVAFGQGLVSSGTLTTSATTSGQIVLSVASATYRDLFVRIQVTSGTAYQTFYLSVIHDGTSAWINNFGTNQTFAITGVNDLATFDATVTGGNLQLLTTPTNAVTIYRAYYEALLV
jgi:hypothetical protein